LVVGLGNPILGDDGVGWTVAEAVRRELNGSDVEVACLSVGGVRLMERLVGYDRVIIIDSMYGGGGEVGTVTCFPIEQLPNPSAGHTSSAHDTSLFTALETGRAMGVDLPDEIEVVAIESQKVHDFSETFTPPVAGAIPQATRVVCQLLSQQTPEGREL